jgi:hypothetical protein
MEDVRPSPPVPPCAQCAAPSRYTCPRCRARHCSLPCVAKHKEIPPHCSGKRDRTAFVAMTDMTAKELRSDVSVLSETEAAVARATRARARYHDVILGSAGSPSRYSSPMTTTTMTSPRHHHHHHHHDHHHHHRSHSQVKLPQSLSLWKNAAEARGVRLLIQQPGMERRRLNASRFDKRHNIITWTVRWLLGPLLLVHEGEDGVVIEGRVDRHAHHHHPQHSPHLHQSYQHLHQSYQHQHRSYQHPHPQEDTSSDQREDHASPQGLAVVDGVQDGSRLTPSQVSSPSPPSPSSPLVVCGTCEVIETATLRQAMHLLLAKMETTNGLMHLTQRLRSACGEEERDRNDDVSKETKREEKREDATTEEESSGPYLLLERCPGNERRFVRHTWATTVKEALRGQVVIEFPTWVVRGT